MPPPPPQVKIHLLDGIFYIFHECMHSSCISCIYRQRSIDLVDGIMHGVMGPLLKFYYKQIKAMLSYKINYEIVLNVLW